MSSDDHDSGVDPYDELDLEALLGLERVSPNDVELLVSIGGCYMKRGQLDQSFAYYSRALAIDPDDGWTHLFMGNLCYALACHDQAATHFQRAIDLLPGIACPHWCLADVYAKQGYWSRTEQQYRQAVETDPSDATAKRKLEAWLAERKSDSHNS